MSGFQIKCETSLPGDGERPPDDIPGIIRRQITPVIPATPVIMPIPAPSPIIPLPAQPPTISPTEPAKQLTITRQQKQ